mgnify:CR=1 FL=1
MFIRCWGSRGSIAVSGRQYVKYGGDTACMEIRSRTGAVIIIDAGTGIRCLGRHLVKNAIKSLDILFTHAHVDHLMGFPFFAPLYTAGTVMRIHGYPYGKKSFRDIIDGLMRCPYFPVTLTHHSIKAKLRFVNIDRKPFSIGGMRITPVPLSHPRLGGRGYRFEENGKSFVFLTDNELDFIHDKGLRFDEYVEFCRGADLLIHDAEYDLRDYKNNRGWGHSLFTDTVKLGLAAGVKRLGLYHLNNRRTDRQVDAMVKQARVIIAEEHSEMKCLAVGSAFQIEI